MLDFGFTVQRQRADMGVRWPSCATMMIGHFHSARHLPRSLGNGAGQAPLKACPTCTSRAISSHTTASGTSTRVCLASFATASPKAFGRA
eukprot:11303206-Alexandrium_andersonii.AAC.1